MLSRLAVAMLMAASMLPSGWVFCVQASGTVEVEYSSGLCCTVAQSIAAEAVAASSIDACEDCQDIALECSAHRKEGFESAAAMATAVCTSPFVCPDTRVESRPLASPTILVSPVLSRLSSVVIRC
jgi:hypothetical protein